MMDLIYFGATPVKRTQKVSTNPILILHHHVNATKSYVHFALIAEMPSCVQISYVFLFLGVMFLS